MKLDQLRYFVKVVESHSFNQAAKELYMTQPALTASMQALEEELQVTLLHRSKKGTYPTAYGLQVYQDCKELLESLETKIESWRAFPKEREKISGIVHLAAIPVACNFMLENIIDSIQQQYPEIEIFLHDIAMLDFSREMLQGHYNVGITSVDVSIKTQEEKQYRAMQFCSEVLLEDEYCIYLSTEHPYAQKPALTQEEYQNLDFITYSYSAERDFTRRFFPAQRLRHLNSLGNILQAVAENKGATILLHKALQNNWYVKNGLICAVPLAGAVLCPSEHHLVYADEKILTAAEKAVVEFIRVNYAAFYETQD